MRVSVVLLLFSLSCAELQRGDDQLTPEDVQPSLNRIQNQSHKERSELLTDQITSQPDVWTELRELRDMVVEQRVQLTSAECQLQNSQSQIEELKNENSDINIRLLDSKHKVDELKKENSAMNSRLLDGEHQVKQMKQDNSVINIRLLNNKRKVDELKQENSALKEMLLDGEHQVEELKQENSAINKTLLVGEHQVEELKQENSALEGRVTSTKQGVEALRENADTPKVAFSFASGLVGHLGPVSSDTILVFSKEITNIGNAFSPITGIFTAPVRGVYYFRFSILGNSHSYQVGAYLFRNEENVIMASEMLDEWNEYATGGAALLLEKEDLVYIKLVAQSKIFDDYSNHCTFSGFLVFPM